jgi:5-methylthioadenosine/S-adenosylhomocysteine deaminase
VDLIVSDATVLTHTEPAEAGYPDDAARRRARAVFLEHSDIGVLDGAIAWVRPAGTTPEEERAGARALDGRGRLAMPGLINCHTHSAMTMFRGSAEDVPVHSWFNDHIWPMEVNLTPRDVALGARLAIGEMLLAGVTTFADHYFWMDEIAKEVSSAGARAVLAPTYFSSEGPAGIDRSAAFAAEWHGAADGRITAMMGPHATYTVVDADLERTARVAAELGIRTHLHAAEGMFQTESSLESRGVTPMQVLHDTGLLASGVLIAHGAGITPDDVRWLAPFADRIGVAACDKVYRRRRLRQGVPEARSAEHDARPAAARRRCPGRHRHRWARLRQHPERAGEHADPLPGREAEGGGRHLAGERARPRPGDAAERSDRRARPSGRCTAPRPARRHRAGGAGPPAPAAPP